MGGCPHAHTKIGRDKAWPGSGPTTNGCCAADTEAHHDTAPHNGSHAACVFQPRYPALWQQKVAWFVKTCLRNISCLAGVAGEVAGKTPAACVNALPFLGLGRCECMTGSMHCPPQLGSDCDIVPYRILATCGHRCRF